MKNFVFILAFVLATGSSKAQFSKQEKNDIIDSLCAKMDQFYIYPEMGDNAIRLIRQKQALKEYDSLTDENTFASQITADMRQGGQDEHLRLEYSPEVISFQNSDPYSMTEEEVLEMHRFALSQNYGIRKIDVLPGNVGLIDLSCIFGADLAGSKYANVMDYLSHTDALIIDLRNCRGSYGTDGINFFSSYFLENTVHLYDFRWRKDHVTEQKWTYMFIPGDRYLNKPVYVLTSARTFSGGEAFAYHLQAQKRVTVIGEQTRGGANPGISIRLNDHFSAFIPGGTTINPVTHSSWESKGVTPDVPVKANMALFETHQIALKACIAKAENEKTRNYIENVLKYASIQPPVFRDEVFELKGYGQAQAVYVTGTFNNWARKTIPMHKKDNSWVATVECEPGIAEYRFIVDEIPMLDPANKQVMNGLEYTNSVRIVR